MHPLLEPLLLAATEHHFPPSDGGVTRFEPLDDGKEAIVSFTGHAFVATRLSPAELEALGADGFGGARRPEMVLAMADGGFVGTEDMTTAAMGLGGGTLPRRNDLDDHHRVRHARAIRRDVEVYGDESGLVTVSIGLAGRTEIGVEVFEPGFGHGRRLIAEARRLVPAATPVFAAVSPGNARSVRAFLSEGFVPIGSEVIIDPARRSATA